MKNLTRLLAAAALLTVTEGSAWSALTAVQAKGGMRRVVFQAAPLAAPVGATDDGSVAELPKTMDVGISPELVAYLATSDETRAHQAARRQEADDYWARLGAPDAVPLEGQVGQVDPQSVSYRAAEALAAELDADSVVARMAGAVRAFLAR